MIAERLIKDGEVSEKFLNLSCDDHPEATRDCTYSGMIYTAPGMPPKAGLGGQPVRPFRPGRAYVVPYSMSILKKRVLVV
jgi:hypothetical protein